MSRGHHPNIGGKGKSKQTPDAAAGTELMPIGSRPGRQGQEARPSQPAEEKALQKDIVLEYLGPSNTPSATSPDRADYAGTIFGNRLPVLALLQHVVRGEQAQAEEFIKMNRNLIFAKEDVIDYSGRRFKNISAWEYALWAYDRHMWKMLLKYIPKDQIPLALAQLNNLEKNGITYTISETVTDPETKAEQTRERTITEPHYDFALIDALQTFVDDNEEWSHEQCVEYWRKTVGGAQRLVPVYVANYYCNPECSFNPIPKFNEDELPRTLKFYNYRSDSIVSWFPLSSSSGFGFDFAIMRGEAAREACGLRWGWAAGKCMGQDLAAVTALYKVRQSEFTQLKQQLQNPAFEADEPESPSRCSISMM
jgi:hypothetical protein